jgi:hypothetical protein
MSRVAKNKRIIAQLKLQLTAGVCLCLKRFKLAWMYLRDRSNADLSKSTTVVKKPFWALV